MKKSYIFIALAMVAALSMVSCKNNKKANESTRENVQEMKQALADSVLAQIDALAEQYRNALAESSIFTKMNLTDEEKLVKPDYLLDPEIANTLVTKTQKINALGMLATDIAVCKVYDMPYDDLRDAATKLAAELNVPFDVKFEAGNEPASEKIKAAYSACKERGDVSLFWQFERALVSEGIYVLSQNPELFLSNITQEQWLKWAVAKQTRIAAVKKLAKYDEELAQINEFWKKNSFMSPEESDLIDQSIDVARQYYIANKDKYATWRNAYLQ